MITLNHKKPCGIETDMHEVWMNKIAELYKKKSDAYPFTSEYDYRIDLLFCAYNNIGVVNEKQT